MRLGIRPLAIAPALLLACGLMALTASSVHAAFGFQPGSTGFNVSMTEPNGAPSTKAGSHPDQVKVHIGLKTAGGYSDGDLRNLDLTLPPSLFANPGAVPECSLAAFHTPRVSPYETSLSGESCSAQSQVGTIAVHTDVGTRHFGLFNLVSPYGVPEAIGASPFGVPLVFAADIREADAATILRLENVPQAFNLQALDVTLWGVPAESRLSGEVEVSSGSPRVTEQTLERDKERVPCLNEADPSAFHGVLGKIVRAYSSDGKVDAEFIPGSCSLADPLKGEARAYLSLPSTCGVPLPWQVSASSWQQPGTATGSAQTGVLSGCIAPLTKAKMQMRTDQAASATGLVFNIEVNDGGGLLNPAGVVRSQIKRASASLPDGLTINPSVGAGLGICTEEQLARESASSEPGAGCPNNSKLGSVSIEGLIGLPEVVDGSVYLAEPYKNPIGSLLALYVTAASPRRGLFSKAIAHIEPDPHTGQLQATFDNLPRLQYTRFTLSLREGQRALMISPPACGAYPTQLQLQPWSGVPFSDSSTFLVNRGSGGGACPSGAVPPFHPDLEAGSINPNAGSYSPFYLHMTRTDAEQEITTYSATFPPGLLGKLAGIPYCPDAAFAAAAVRTGTAELNSPSCPTASEVGRTLAGYGVGGVLAYAPGKLYLAGPYNGSSLSIVAVNSALVGPFDLGVVIVRSAIRVDPRTAQASIDSLGSDPIPHILKGIPIHLRDIRVHVDRPGFTVNGTSCDVLQTQSLLTGAGLDIAGSGDDSRATSTDRFQLANCSALGFAPRLSMRLKGGVKRGRYPALRATYTPRPGHANLKSAAVTLPSSMFLAQEHLDTVCTLVQYRARNCPKGSVIGTATAITPLLDEPMSGPVYLRSSTSTLPDLVARIEGRGISIDVLGGIDSKKGGIRTRFDVLPDGPVTQFKMNLFGGKRGLLQNSENLCRSSRSARASFVAHNNKVATRRVPLKADCKKGKRGKGKGKRKGARR